MQHAEQLAVLNALAASRRQSRAVSARWPEGAMLASARERRRRAGSGGSPTPFN